MPAARAYADIPHLDPRVKLSTRERVALLVMGTLDAKSAAPARIARALRARLDRRHRSC